MNRLTGGATLFLRGSKLGLAGAALVAGTTLVAIFSPLFIPSSVIYGIHAVDQFLPPTWAHLFGTDVYGRDLFQLSLLAVSTDLQIAYLVTAASLVLGVLVGGIAGYSRPAIDEALMRITDIFLAIPSFILAMAIAVVAGGGIFNTALALIVAIWPSYARIIRGQVIAEKNKLYIDSLRMLNVGGSKILLRHIMPNVIYPVIAFLTIQVGVTILFLSGLTFIGFSSGPFTPELGRMVSDGLNYFLQAPWLVVFPGMIISILVFGFNLVGDGLREILDPRLKNAREV